MQYVFSVIRRCEMLMMLMLLCRPSDSDVVDSVDDDDVDVTKPTSTSVAPSSKHLAGCSVPEVLRTSSAHQGPSVELVNEKSTSAVNILCLLCCSCCRTFVLNK